MTDARILTYVEIDIDYCALTYGVSPCTAALGVTGDKKCFNTPGTCQDRVDFTNAPVTLRFAVPTDYLPLDIEAVPSITSVSFTPGTVSLGEDLGQRATLSIGLMDHPWSDTGPGYDKYYAERDYDPYKQGSYWGKFRARNPFVRGRPLRLIRGRVGQALADMETRHYIIDSFDGPTPTGTFTLTAKDVLKLADGDRAQAPHLSDGFLVANITDTDQELVLSPLGIGDLEYPLAGYVSLGGKEIVSFTRDPLLGLDANTKLLLHFDGDDGVTTFIDSSASAHVATAVGNAQLDVAQANFGVSSLLLDGTGDYVTFPDSADWALSNAVFTIDFWVRHNTLATTQHYFAQQNTSSGSTNQFFLNVAATGVITFSVISGGTTIITMASAAGAITAGSWHHVALVRKAANVFNIYVDGVSVATVTDTDSIPDYTDIFRIGADRAGVNALDGWLDEFRISNVARWTAAFTPPVSRYMASTDNLAIVRAQFGTAAIAHTSQDRAQLCIYYEGEDPADLIYDLLVNYAEVPASFVTLANWLTETTAYYRQLLTAMIAEPTAVKDLVAEIIQQAALAVWWDDLGQQIRLQVLRAISTTAETFDTDTVLEGTLRSQEQPDLRLSEVWTFYGQRNPLDPQTNEDNYRSVAATVDLQKETDYGSSAIKKIFSRWIPAFGRTIAERLNNIQLGRFVDPPRRFNFNLMPDADVALGGGYQLSWPALQDDTGARVNVPIQVTRLSPEPTVFIAEAQEMRFTSYDAGDLTNKTIIIDSNTLRLNMRDVYNTLFPDPVYGDSIVCIVQAGVVVGSDILGVPAFDVGDWPEGVDILLQVAGKIEGRGGNGGGTATHPPDHHLLLGDDGQAGSTALYTRFPITVDGTGGNIWGGGGGAGGSSGSDSGGAASVGGSGGGAGSQPGAGGNSWNGGAVGASGTETDGGIGGAADYPGADGGDPGSAGANNAGKGGEGPTSGGAAGAAVDGESFVTYDVLPTFMGARVN